MAGPDILNDTLRFGASLMQRATHDLAGVVGALGAALEMADEPEAMEIVRESARSLKHRLRLARAIWRPAREAMPVAELRDLLPALPGASRLTFRLDRLVDPVPAAHVAVTLAALVVAAEGLPHGGLVELSGDLSIALDGTHAAWPNRLAVMLRDPATAHEALATAEPQDMGAAVCAALAHRDAARARVSGSSLHLHWP